MTTTLTSFYLQPLLAFSLGLCAAWICAVSLRPSRAILLSTALLPPVVAVALLAVNGSVGTSIAVLGVFGLVRFRSLPGRSVDMVCVLYSMVIGLLSVSGNWIASILLSGSIGLFLYSLCWFLARRPQEMQLMIVVPESMPEEAGYRSLLESVGRDVRLERMKSAGMGTLYELSYRFVPRHPFDQTALLDEIRARNGNLAVTLTALSESSEQF